MTTAQGAPLADDQNSLRIGDRGPTALEDFVLREKIFHFDHERIPERVVHARGYGAHGYLRDARGDPRADRAASSSVAAYAPRRSSASRRWPATSARPTSPATCAASR
jgi:catalase